MNIAWTTALNALADYLKKPVKIDVLVEKYAKKLDSNERMNFFALFNDCVRNFVFLEAEFAALYQKKPKFLLRALLYLAGSELMDSALDKRAKVVHYSVEMAGKLISAREKKFVNAVLRSFCRRLDDVSVERSLAHQYSHPDWLVEKWYSSFGEEATLSLLKWNQSTNSNYVRWDGKAEPDFLEKTQWPTFYKLNRDEWSQIKKSLDSFDAYICDPSTNVPVELAQISGDEQVLDLCSSPGGKSRNIAKRLTSSACLLSIDLEGRMDRLRENLPQDHFKNVHCLASDVMDLEEVFFSSRNLVSEFDVVLIDVPCSNTGVLRRRPDAKLRLNKSDIHNCAVLQLQLLEKASEFVKDGGRLVYSTCSIESDENEQVIESFLDKSKGFVLESAELSYPWQTGHDGGGAFLLKKT